MPIIKSTNVSVGNSAANIKSENTDKGVKKSRKLVLILVLLVIVGLGGTGYFYSRYKAATKDPNIVAKKEVDSILGKLSKLMLLPADETPTIATVMDKEKLVSQPFFGKAQNGDKLIVYAKSKKAILFREKDNLIVEVAPVYFDNNAQAATNNTPAAQAPANN